jgi:hypothetical protein
MITLVKVQGKVNIWKDEQIIAQFSNNSKVNTYSGNSIVIWDETDKLIFDFTELDKANCTPVVFATNPTAFVVEAITSFFPNVQTSSGGGGGVSAIVSVDNFPATQPITGMVTVINPLATELTLSQLLGQAEDNLARNGTIVSTNESLGAKVDLPALTDIGDFSIIAFIKRALSNWTTLLARIPALVSGRIPVDGSGVTQPISGTITIANPTETGLSKEITLESIDTNIGAQSDATASSDSGTFSIIAFIKRALSNWTTLLGRVATLGQKTIADSMPVVIASDQILTSIASGNRSSYSPFYGATDAIEVVQGLIDSGGSLVSRSAILTDEGTYRINFANSSLAVPIGTISNITNNIVTGTGFSDVDVHLKDYFKLDADAESSWSQIASIDSDTQITLYQNYVGGTSGLASRSLVKPTTGAGASITVLNGQGVITAGTTSGAVSILNRSVDYAPLVFRTRLSISQRIANQNIRIGFAEGSPAPRFFARFRCDGAISTVNTTIICETGRNPTQAPSASETETTTVTIPNGGNTSQFLEYRIEHLIDFVRFYINDILVAQHTRSLPSPYDFMASGVRIENVGVPSSSTVITIDYAATKNHNKIEIGVMSDNEKIVASQPLLTPFLFSQAGVIAINTDLLIIDCSQLRTVNLQATSIGTTGRLDFFSTNDLSVTGTAQPAYPIGGAAAVTTTTAAGNWNIPTNGAKFLRVRLGVTTTAGTTTLFASGSPFAQPLPLPTTQPVSGTVTATVSSTTANFGTNGMSAFADSVANLGIGVTFAGTSRDGGATQAFARFTARAFSDQAGTFRIEQSADNTNWRRATSDTAVAANAVIELTVFATARYHRVVYINGAVAQTIFILNSAYLRV